MSSQSPKKPGFGDLSAAELNLMLASTFCSTAGGKLDYDKLGFLAGMKKKSASTRYPAVRRKLHKMFEDQLDKFEDESLIKGKPPVKRRKIQLDFDFLNDIEPDLKTEAASELKVKSPAKEIKQEPVDDDHSEDYYTSYFYSTEGADPKVDTPLKANTNDLDSNPEDSCTIKVEPTD
ncbi:hypothetical protein N7457_003261 [Penicillium paradoxum]|uniref:uncharacterized protein n=1 Tax=Penicillium paradoxum TaxID=176176 RepID=UPI0025496263|nr:uncharacterized protein N7457_003261 [Penicillium paradoxum]KAJ5788271.1 hypothetical protein N7457_003261 [Penicillium paradoxum]